MASLFGQSKKKDTTDLLRMKSILLIDENIPSILIFGLGLSCFSFKLPIYGRICGLVGLVLRRVVSLLPLSFGGTLRWFLYTSYVF